MLFDIIKIKYVNEGYLPDWPYHLLADDEMFDAFIFNEDNYFDVNYPCPGDKFKENYEVLKKFIQNKITSYQDGEIDKIPNWVYTYMLGEVLNFNSPEKDRHDFFVLLNLDNLYDEFNDEIYQSVYDLSRKIAGLQGIVEGDPRYRPATFFGEPFIIKYLRLEQVGV